MTRGFVFYTNKESRKSDELAANPQVTLLFHWKSLAGRSASRARSKTSPTPRRTPISPPARAFPAWAPGHRDQSRPLDERTTLERRLAEYEAKYPGDDIPRPPYWSGYRVLPERFEFWQNMPFRLHDRTIYTRDPAGGWSIGKLFP